MKPTVTILDAVQDLFAGSFKDKQTWSAWFAFLRALFALPLSEAELALYRQCTGRQQPPSQPASEAWLVCGRRAGKSFTLALIAVFLAAFFDYRKYLNRGERGTIMVIAADRKQARTILRYIRALLTQVPMLRQMIVREAADGFDLNNQICLEIHTCSFRSTRGYTIVAALLDEVAYWPTDDSAEPDTEVIAAIKPGMATIPNAVLLCASSPYGRRGVLWQSYKKNFGKDGDVLVWQAATRVMNPTIPQSVVDAAMQDDPAKNAAEYLAQFRSDIEGFVSREAVEACVATGVFECPAQPGCKYVGFTDPSGGSNDAFTLAIAHRDADQVFLDCVREVRPPFSPEVVVAEFAGTLKSYGLHKVQGDNYAKLWPVEVFARHKIRYEQSAKPKNDLYLALLPLINSHRVELLDHPRLLNQLIGLERRTARGGRDTVDHAPGAHDDVANAVAGAVLAALGAYKERIRGYTRGPDYVSNVRSIEFDPETGRKIEPEHAHIRVVHLTEQEAPAVRGRVHSKLGS